jgi:hypothetical protein
VEGRMFAAAPAAVRWRIATGVSPASA